MVGGLAELIGISAALGLLAMAAAAHGAARFAGPPPRHRLTAPRARGQIVYRRLASRRSNPGRPEVVEGGIAILLLLILVAVIGAAMLGLFGTGGALSLRRRGDAKRESRERPTHSRQTTPYHENTTFVGVDERAGPVRSDERPARGIAHSVTPARRGGTMSCKAALIVIDMLNTYEHTDSDRWRSTAGAMPCR